MAAFFKKKEKNLEPLPPLPPSMDDDFESLPDLDESDELDEFSDIDTLPKETAKEHFMPMQSSAPAKVFVKIDKYEDMLDTIDEIKEKVAELEETINKVSEIKSKETDILEGWKALLLDTKRRIEEVNTALNVPEK